MDLILRFVGAIVALALVLGLAFVVLRWMNKRVPGMGTGGGRMINVLDRVSYGRNTSLLLVRVQDKVLLVATSEHAIEKLCEFDDPEGKLTLPKAAENPSFAAALKDAAAKFGLKPKNGGPGEGGGE